MRQVTPELLALVLGRTDVDAFDLYAAAAFDKQMTSREARATGAYAELESKYQDLPEGFIEAVLDKFRIGGVAEISSSELFGLSPFTSAWGGVFGVTSRFGGPENVAAFLQDVHDALFDAESNE